MSSGPWTSLHKAPFIVILVVAVALATTTRASWAQAPGPAAAPTGPSVEQRVTHPRHRIDGLIDAACQKGLLKVEQGERLKSEWSAQKVGDLDPAQGMEEGLIQGSRGRGLIDDPTAKALTQLASTRRLDDLGMSAGAGLGAGSHTGDLAGLTSLAVWFAGLALASGLLYRVMLVLVRAPRSVQALAAGLTTTALWAGARVMLERSEEVTATSLAIGGCLGSLLTAGLTYDALNLRWRPRLVIGLCVSLVWGSVYAWVPVSTLAYLTAVATAVALGMEMACEGVWLDRMLVGVPWTRRSAFIGALMIAAGFGFIAAQNSVLRGLVHPFWAIGLSGLLGGHVVEWEHPASGVLARRWSITLALASVIWGLTAPEGLFVGAGGLVLLGWICWRCDKILRRFATPEYMIGAGALILGAARLAEQHWVQLLAILQATSY